jgi:hypothetical protein
MICLRDPPKVAISSLLSYLVFGNVVGSNMTHGPTILGEYYLEFNKYVQTTFNPLSPELNPICYLLALIAHDFLHVSRVRVKSLTLRLLMTLVT